MNWRAIIIGIIGLILLISIAIGAWLFLSGSSSNQNANQEAPEVSVAPGTLPDTSTDGQQPVQSPSNTVLAFRGVCKDSWAGQADSDLDLVPDSVETVYGTDVGKKDTDEDGYSDSAEITTGHNPLRTDSGAMLDSDVDGLLDHEECDWHTDPFNPDSDADGFKDGAEVKNGFDPAKAGDGKGSDKLQSATLTPGGGPFTNPGTGTSGTGSSTGIPNLPPTTGTSQFPNYQNSQVQISLIPSSQIRTVQNSGAADIRSYLTTIDGLRPQELADGQLIATAIQNAAKGNVAQLTQVRVRIAQFSTALKGVSVPRAALEYHQLYISIIDFTAQGLQAVEQNVSSDPQKALRAILEIKDTLPSYVTRLSTLRKQLETLAAS